MFEFRKPKSTREKSGIFTNLFFCWTFPLIWRIWRQNPKQSKQEQYPLFLENDSSSLGARVSLAWKNELETKVRPKLSRALLRIFKTQFTRRIVVKIFAQCIIRVALGPAMWVYLSSVAGEFDIQTNYTATGALVVLSLLFSLLENTESFLWSNLGSRIRIALTVLVYQKALNLSQIQLNSNAEETKSLISTDVHNFDRYADSIPAMIVAPFEIVAVVGVLCFYLGPVALVIIPLLLLVLGFQRWLGKYVVKYQHLVTSKANHRISLFKEILNGIKLIKISGWEMPYTESVSKARISEIKSVRIKMRFVSLINSVQEVSARLIFLGTITLFILLGGQVSVTSVFVSLTMIKLLESLFTGAVRNGFDALSEMTVSIQRIQAFLMLEECESSNTVAHQSTTQNKSKTNKLLQSEYESLQVVKSNYTFRKTFLSKYVSPKLYLEDACAGQQSSSKPCFQNIWLEARPGDLIIVTGPTGSGKSSLLQAILGELPLITGRIEALGRIAYVPQTPWLFAGTIQENILFNQPYDPVWYNTVIRSCGLAGVISVLPLGDRTTIGYTGTALNAGHKARISLARAMYSNADIYILDNPLSPLTPTLRTHIFEECILGLLKPKITLMVTNQSQFFTKASEVLVMKEGIVESRGSIEKIRSLIANQKPNDDQMFDLTRLNVDATPFVEMGFLDSPNWRKDINLLKQYGTFNEKLEHSKEDEDSKVKRTGGHRQYLTTGNNYFKIGFFFVVILTFQGLLTASDFWLKMWTSIKGIVLEEGEALSSGDFFLEAFAVILIVLFLLGLIKNQLLVSITTSASLKMHNFIIAKMILAPVPFIEHCLSGDNLNRILDNFKFTDHVIPRLYYSFSNKTMLTLGYLVIIMVMIPIMVAPTVIGFLFAFGLYKFYIRSVDHVIQAETIAQATVKAHFTNTIQGISTIRVFQVEQAFKTQFLEILDQHTAKYHFQKGAQRWYTWTMSLLSNAYLVTLLCVFVTIPVDIPTIGLTLYSAIFLNLTFADALNELIELKRRFESVIRILDYNKICEEGLRRGADQKRLRNWPSSGKIEILDLVIKCENNLHDVDGITMKINSKEKIGFFGPIDDSTKTTLILTILRFLEPNAGCIKIDNIDISTVGLHDLRTKVGVIPKSSVLFRGTIRQNLDPFNKYSDKELWSSIDQVNLLDKVRDLSVAGLDTQARQTDYNLGELKLLAISRAILNDCKIIILEEPWPGDDPRTDRLVQQTVHEKFKDCTLLIIASQYESIKKCDRVFVLESGKVVDCGTPLSLFRKSDVNKFTRQNPFTEENRIKIFFETQ